MSTVGDGWSLGLVREWLRGRVDAGETCPCCGQYAKVYRRKLTGPTAAVLIAMYQQPDEMWVHLPSLPQTEKGGDAIKAKYWGLIEEMHTVRVDGSKRVGWWRLTDLGRSFVRNTTAVPKYARIYDGRCLGLDTTEHVTIRDVLGTKFNYDELMEGR